MLKLSVILCAHNPRADYLEETVASLRCQKIEPDLVEFVLVDNGSDPEIASSFVDGFPYAARIVKESELGLTHARLRGILESKGELLVFVDDDNVLNENYLLRMQDKFSSNRLLGCAGGTITPRFESEPPDEWRPLTSCLALRNVESISITNQFIPALAPYGAGMGLRRIVAEEYLRSVESEPWRKELGRKGQSLASAEDIDITCTACDLGLACGLFPDLTLMHLIPANRTQPDYLKRLALGIAQSNFLLRRYRNLPGGTLKAICKEAFFAILRGKQLKKKSLFIRGKLRGWRLSRQG